MGLFDRKYKPYLDESKIDKQIEEINGDKPLSSHKEKKYRKRLIRQEKRRIRRTNPHYRYNATKTRFLVALFILILAIIFLIVFVSIINNRH